MIRKYRSAKKHICESTKIVDWIIYECPECDYQLWEDLSTGELKIFNSKLDINHSGFYSANEYTLNNL